MKHIARSTLIIAIFFGLEKILGFLRNVIIARTFQLSAELDALAGFSPHQRDYIRALVQEAQAPLINEINNLRSQISAKMSHPSEQKMSDMRNDINWLLERYRGDDKYALTRAKLVTFMKMQGIY